MRSAVCDLDGAFVEGPPSATQCFEVMLQPRVGGVWQDYSALVSADLK